MTYISERIDWQQYTIEIRFFKNKFKVGMHDGNHISHLEVECIDPPRAPLPMTETGYRSHHAQTDVFLQYETITEFVLGWLDHAAQSDDWKEREEQSKQPSLF